MAAEKKSSSDKKPSTRKKTSAKAAAAKAAAKAKTPPKSAAKPKTAKPAAPAVQEKQPPLTITSAAAGRVARRRARKAGTLPEDTSPLTPKEIEHFRELLLVKRREVIGDVDSMWNGESSHQESAGDLSNMPIHMADVGTDNYEQEFTLDLVEGERRLLREIDRALAKIENDTYGFCEGTSKPIGRARLEAKPEARYTIEYARKLEQGLVAPPTRREIEDRFGDILDEADRSESA